MTLRPVPAGSVARASLVIFFSAEGAAQPLAQARRFSEEADGSRVPAAQMYRRSIADSLQIETPDEQVNAALVWSGIALDQAWACNSRLGCGALAGFGPSRPGRRPQYAWFFAGDGLIAVDAWVSEGEFERAREELEFILRYQDARTGMVWHELSQSAPWLPWRERSPYMFAHVNITYQFLAALERYVRASGDDALLRDHWLQVLSAYRYCESLLDAGTGLPRIPAGKQDIDEQHQLIDSAGLSAEWALASAATENLARIMRDQGLAARASRAAAAARRAIASRYWDPSARGWLRGHAVGGAPIPGGSGAAPLSLLGTPDFDTPQEAQLLDDLAGADWQTDWGARSLSAGSSDYDPNAYASGSVWALRTADVARMLWRMHRPGTAWQVWRALVNWNRVDAPGHMHEVLAGDLFHAELESVPAQTWSSAGLVDAAVSGLLGLTVDPRSGTVRFAPWMPGDWPMLALRNVRVGAASVSFVLRRDDGALDLDVENPGAAFSLRFEPNLPLGAQDLEATKGDDILASAIDGAEEDPRARVVMTIGHGRTHCHLRYRGGVYVLPIVAEPLAGAPSSVTRLVRARLTGGAIEVQLDARRQDQRVAAFDVLTDLKPAAIDNGAWRYVAPRHYRVELDPSAERPERGGYQRVTVRMQFN